jgi:hypothetical protein
MSGKQTSGEQPFLATEHQRAGGSRETVDFVANRSCLFTDVAFGLLAQLCPRARLASRIAPAVPGGACRPSAANPLRNARLSQEQETKVAVRQVQPDFE